MFARLLIIALVNLGACGRVGSEPARSRGGLALVPASAEVGEGERISFFARGGQSPYQFALLSGTGVVNPTGEYAAVAQGVDVVRVVDARGDSTVAEVSVGPRQPGAFDVSFGDRGQLIIAEAGAYRGYGLATLADDSLAVVGNAETSDGELDVIALLVTTAGALDTGFGGGVAAVDFGTAGDVAAAVAVQADGKMVVAGSTYVDNTRTMVVTRLLADGTVDAGFATGGVWSAETTTPLGGAAYDLLVQADEKIVVVGENRDQSDCVVHRLLSDGSPDTGFGSNGRVRLSVSDSVGGYDSCRAVALAADGSIVTAGKTTWEAVLFKLTASGSLDAGFADAGTMVPDLAIAFPSLYDLAVLPDASVVAVGSGGQVLRLHADGTLNTEFGDNGVARVTSVSTSGVALAVQADGTMVIAAGLANGDNYVVGLFHVDARGAPVTAFGDHGAVILDPTFGRDDLQAMVNAPGGRVVVLGSAGDDLFISRHWLF